MTARNMCCIFKLKLTLLLMIYFLYSLNLRSFRIWSSYKNDRREREGRVCVINGTWNAKSKPGAVTVKRKLSVRETAEVIRKSHLKKKIRPWLSSYVTNQNFSSRKMEDKKKEKHLRQYLWGGLDPLWSSSITSRFQMKFPHFILSSTVHMNENYI